jgi:hypothetical protein
MNRKWLVGTACALLIALFGTPAAAQDWQLDTVLLVSGGRLRGNVVEQSPESGVKLRLPDGTIRTVPPAEVKTVEFAIKPKPSSPPEADPPEAEPPDSEPEDVSDAESGAAKEKPAASACVFNEDCGEAAVCEEAKCQKLTAAELEPEPVVLVLLDGGVGATGIFSGATIGAVEFSLNLGFGIPLGPISLGVAGQFRSFYVVDLEQFTFGGNAGLLIDGEPAAGFHLGATIGGVGIEGADRTGGPGVFVHALYGPPTDSPYRFYFGGRTGGGALFSIRDPIGLLSIDAVAGLMVQ